MLGSQNGPFCVFCGIFLVSQILKESNQKNSGKIITVEQANDLISLVCCHLYFGSEEVHRVKMTSEFCQDARRIF